MQERWPADITRHTGKTSGTTPSLYYIIQIKILPEPMPRISIFIHGVGMDSTLAEQRAVPAEFRQNSAAFADNQRFRIVFPERRVCIIEVI